MSFGKKKKSILRQQRIAKILGKVIGCICSTITTVLPQHICIMTRNYIAQQLTKKPICQAGINYIAEGPVSYIRIFFTPEKERETCAWIETFPQDAVFWDIGANIGTFALLAAQRKITTYAFEPHPANYLNLVQNIAQNQFSDHLAAFPIALHDHTTIAPLHLSDLEVGMAWNSFSDTNTSIQRSCKLHAIGFSIDEFIQRFELPIPTHIKMDVDGNELKILAGAKNTLANPTLRELLVEIDADEQGEDGNTIKNMLINAGFHIESVHPHGERCANVIFVRSPT